MERLTDEELASIDRAHETVQRGCPEDCDADGLECVHAVEHERAVAVVYLASKRLLAEVRTTRARELTEDERHALRAASALLATRDGYGPALAVLTRLIGDGKSDAADRRW